RRIDRLRREALGTRGRRMRVFHLCETIGLMNRLPLAWAVLLIAGQAGAQQYSITTVAGGVPPVTPQPALEASIGDPARVATDSAGNVYFASLHSVFKVD